MNALELQQILANRREEKPVHVLFVGRSLAGMKRVFKRQDEVVRCDHAADMADAVTMIETQAAIRPFDCIMVDMRCEEDGTPLNVVAIAALKGSRHLAVLASDENAESLEGLVGIDTILRAPVDPKEIILTIVNSAPDRSPDVEEFIAIPRKNPLDEPQDNVVTPTVEKPAGAPAVEAVDDDVSEAVEAHTGSDAGEEKQEAAAKSTITKGFESSLALAQEADQQVWQRFVPLANFLYKKLAIVVLSALFLTFLAYGAMIVFFMSSSSWSLPFELSRGHLLVEKAERDLSSMRLRRNQIRQDLTLANVELSKAERDRRDGNLQLTLTKRTVEEEIIRATTDHLEIGRHISRLKQVIGDFNTLNGKGGYARNLKGAFSQRLITRKALNSGTLAVLETMHRIATVQNEISLKQIELQNVTRKLEFLRSLLDEIKQPEIRVVTSAGSDLAHLAREVIESKNLIAAAERTSKAAGQRVTRFNNSLEVISKNISSLEATPVARAIKAPVMVLFVPYTNTHNLAPGTTLHGCALSFFFCSRVGEVGAPVDGETTAVHPLFGKPMRGTFVEATFTDPKSVTEEIVHAGRAPLFF